MSLFVRTVSGTDPDYDKILALGAGLRGSTYKVKRKRDGEVSVPQCYAQLPSYDTIMVLSSPFRQIPHRFRTAVFYLLQKNAADLPSVNRKLCASK
jgi:hypothetical protein